MNSILPPPIIFNYFDDEYDDAFYETFLENDEGFRRYTNYLS